jgi:hypothetical protein
MSVHCRVRLAVLIALAAVLVVPVVTLAADPFESAPGPVMPAPRARPATHAPATAPAQPREPEAVPAASLTKIRQFAAERGLPLPPDMQIVRPADDVPLQFARFSGAWGGDARWNGHGRQPLIVVEMIDRTGRATLVYVNGPPTPSSYNQNPARWWRVIGTIDGQTLSFEFGRGFRIRLTMQDDQRIFAVDEPNLTMTPPFHGAKVWLPRLS